MDTGKGDVYGILKKYNTTYELIITNRLGLDLDGNRCDGTLSPSFRDIFNDEFSFFGPKNFVSINTPTSISPILTKITEARISSVDIIFPYLLNIIQGLYTILDSE